MRIQMLASMILSLGLIQTSEVLAAEKTKAKLPDLVKICKKECPDAKSNNEAHECAEDKAKDTDGEAFKKGKCWLENEKYEKMIGE